MVDPEFGDSIIDVNHRHQLVLVVGTAVEGLMRHSAGQQPPSHGPRMAIATVLVAFYGL